MDKQIFTMLRTKMGNRRREGKRISRSHFNGALTHSTVSYKTRTRQYFKGHYGRHELSYIKH